MIYDDGEPLPDRPPTASTGGAEQAIAPEDPRAAIDRAERYKRLQHRAEAAERQAEELRGQLEAARHTVKAWDSAAIVTALQASPELREEVLGAFWSPDEVTETAERAAKLWQEIGEPALREQLSTVRLELATERGIVADYIELTKGLRSELAAAQAELERVRAELEYERAARRAESAFDDDAPAEPKPADTCSRCGSTYLADRSCPASNGSLPCNPPDHLLRDDGPKPAEPACWCHRCDETPPFRRRMILCPTCGNKRCPKASWHDYQCTGSNEPGQLGVEEDKRPAEPALPTTRLDCGEVA